MATPKQAVVLIHGIGEQVPMDTLRGFVRAVWTTDEAVRNPYVPDQVWSKPDNVSQNHELRRLTTAEGKNGQRTDFFEFYWADLMEGTEVEHVQAWLKLLLVRSPRQVPKQLRGIWWTVVMLLSIALLIILVGLFTPVPAKTGWSAGIVFTAFSYLLLSPIRKVVGDAARYLHVAPPNIGKRRAIRDAGIRLLRRLHASGEYDRIILVGHSLGTVIGYDILTHLWPHYNTKRAGSTSSAPDPLEVLADKKGLTADEYQAGQTQYAATLKAAGNPWLVTDFITMGSPLAHASFLLTRKSEEFETKKKERELPTCPPTLEKVRKHKRFHYPFNLAWVPNHAAVFGPTRWTNLYFPCVNTLKGDVIGGPLHPAFGHGIRDIEVTTTINGGRLNHTHYWEFPEGATAAPDHILALRKALQLSTTFSHTRPMHLSKSDFKACVDCATRLHYRKNKFPSAKDDNEYLQFLADGGFMVEFLAKAKYPKHVDLVDIRDPAEAFEKTKAALESDGAIFEAAANSGPYHVRTDILVKEGNILRLIEVKSSSVKTGEDERDEDDSENEAKGEFLTKKEPRRVTAKWVPYLQDLTFQTIVLEAAFPEYTVQPFLAVMDKSQVATAAETLDQFTLTTTAKRSRPEVTYKGDVARLLDSKLIVTLDATEAVDSLRASVAESAKHLVGLLSPDGVRWERPDLGAKYRECKDCEFRTEPTAGDKRSGFITCWDELAHSPTHILDLYRVGQIGQPDPIPPLLLAKQSSYLELTEQQLGKPGGTWTLRRTMQWRGMQAEKENLPQELRDELQAHYGKPGYPLHFIDFEACNISLPHHPGLHPYERVAFQWSCHTVDQNGKVEHREWINPGTAFPNFEFVRTLRAQIGDTGTVYVWSSYEQGTLKTILEQMENAAARQLPEFDAALPAWLETLLGPSDSKGKRHDSPRIRDLHRLALKHYFHPRMQGRTSIKVVLPAVWETDAKVRDHPCFKQYHQKAADGSLLEPYQTLEKLPLEESMGEVREGTAAVRIYQEMLFGQGTKDNGNRRKLLLQYCQLDTAAMLMIWVHWLKRYDIHP